MMALASKSRIGSQFSTQSFAEFLRAGFGFRLTEISMIRPPLESQPLVMDEDADAVINVSALNLREASSRAS